MFARAPHRFSPYEMVFKWLWVVQTGMLEKLCLNGRSLSGRVCREHCINKVFKFCRNGRSPFGEAAII